MREGGRNSARLVGAISAVLLLCAVVGAASVGRRAETEPSIPFDGRAAASLVAAVSFLALAGFLAMAINLLVRMLRSDEDEGPDEEDDQASALEVLTPLWLQRLILAGIVAMIALCCWVTWIVVRAFLATAPPPDAAGATSAPVNERLTNEVTNDTLPMIAVYVLVGMIVALLVLTVMAALRRGAGEDDYELAEPEGPMNSTELAGVAFALAQRMLQASGFGARWEETSAEHVHRVGPTLPGAAPPALDHLLALYHEAKFSVHPITAAHRRDAVAALTQLRATLAPMSLTVATTP